MKQRLKDIIYIALFAVIIAVCSWISVPFAIPFTMQTFAVFITLLLLGGRRGVLTVFVYIMLGVVGAPVFAGFGSGIGTLMGATGGYILGFALMALVYWLITALCRQNAVSRIVGCIAGLIICYVFGSVWFCFVYSHGDIGGLQSSLALCVLPYLLPDAAKLLLAYLLSKRLSKLI